MVAVVELTSHLVAVELARPVDQGRPPQWLLADSASQAPQRGLWRGESRGNEPRPEIIPKSRGFAERGALASAEAANKRSTKVDLHKNRGT